MKIALYRAEHGGLLDKLINTFSGRLGFSHCEIIFSDGVFFSSSGMDGGVRFKKIDPNESHWRCYELDDVDYYQEEIIRAWCDTQVGKKYDFKDVLEFLIPLSGPTHQSQKKWFCSEIIIAALQRIGYYAELPAWKISPNDLFLLLEGDRDD